MPYPLVCLDAGFTLIRPRESTSERLARVLVEHGHAADEEELRRAWDLADAWFWEEYHRPGNDAWASDARITETWRSYHRLMLQHLGFADRDRELLEAVLVAQMATESWEPYEDTMPALRSLRGLRLGPDGSGRTRLVVVSDWGSALLGLLDGLGIAAVVDDVLASGAVGLAKPAPELYRLACRRAGVEPDAAVMIGDSLRADVMGARDAGLDAVLLDRAGTAGDPGPGVPVVRTLTEAVELVRAGPPLPATGAGGSPGA